ncbi:hypothetical protein EPO15_03620 [bacterium]|nr:MAG: hypothetical protein EPO15_03620 [bacterium]
MTSETSRERWDFPLGALGLFAAAAWTWGRWADLWVDFGLELELPRRLALGEVLYRDIIYKNGPLSPYFNALLFKCFGAHIELLTTANLVIASVVLALLWSLARRAYGRAAAAAVSAVYAGIFAFSQYLWTANFNFAAPYSHCQTHGIALGLGAVWAWASWLESGASRRGLMGGALLGLLFLTKAELFVPAAATAALAVAAASRRGRPWRRDSGLALAAAGAVPVAAFLLLSAAMPWTDACRGVLGNWAAPTAPLGNPFYVAGLGFDAPLHRLLALGGGAAVLTACVGWAFAAQRYLGGRLEGASAHVLGGLALLHAAAAYAIIPLRSAALGVEPIVWALAAWGAWRLMRQSQGGEVPGLWAAYAALSFGKMILAPRFGQYGFALALPGAALTAAWLVGEAPELARRRFGGGRVARAVLAGLVVAAVAVHLQWSESFNRQKTLRLDPPASSVTTFGPESDERGLFLNAFLDRARTLIPPGATLLPMPEGAMLNFLLDRRNPTPYLLFLPEDFRLFGGESVVVGRLTQTPPDYIALLSRETREFGVGRFGSDERYGAAILRWVEAHYFEVGRVGADPVRDRRFGISLWRRR